MFCTNRLTRLFNPTLAAVAALPHRVCSSRFRTTSHADPHRGGIPKDVKHPSTYHSSVALQLVHSPLAAGRYRFLTRRRVVIVVRAAKNVRTDVGGNGLEEDLDARSMEDTIPRAEGNFNDGLDEEVYRIGVHNVDHDLKILEDEEEPKLTAASPLLMETTTASSTAQPRLPRPRSNSSSKRSAVALTMTENEDAFDPVIVSAGVVAIAIVGFLAFQRKTVKRHVDAGSPDSLQLGCPPANGFSASRIGGAGNDFSSSSRRGPDEDLPVGNISFEGLPIITDDDASFSTPPPREIHGEFKRQLRDMMSEMRRYNTVDFHGRNLGDNGSAYISEALAFNDVATCIDLSANGMGEAGVFAICEALKSNSALEMLSLASNNLQDAGAVALANYLQSDSSINTLNLNSCGISDTGAIALAEMLKKNTSLVALELNNNNIDYEGTCAIAEALSENATLTTLSISGNYIGGLGASALAKGLVKNKGLKGLIINGNDIGNIGVEALCKAISARETKLTNLDMGNNGIGHESGEYIAAYIKTDKELASLNLYMNELCDLGAIAVCNALRQNTAIQILDIGGNNILQAGAESLGDALKENISLRTLEIGYNPIGPKGGAALADAFKFHSKLTTLRMGWCKITKEGARHIADAMKYNEHVTTLDLRGNELGDEGCAAIAQSLGMVNENLTSLDLGYNEIKDNGAFALAQAIKNNADASITSISLNNNYITKFGEVALTEAVELVQELNPGRDLYIQL